MRAGETDCFWCGEPVNPDTTDRCPSCSGTVPARNPDRDDRGRFLI